MSLFDAEPSTYTVADLWRDLRAALDGAFPDDVWVTGEIRNLKRSGRGHVYFDLVDPPAPGRPPEALVSVVLFNDIREIVNKQLVRTGAARMTDGVKLRIRAVVDAYERQGRVQLRMTGIDLNYTLGQLAAERERLVRLLADEGLLDANSAVAFPPLPLRVGLVTSYASAAYHDFVHELERSGLGFEVVCADCTVQGDGAEWQVAAGVATLARHGVDVIAVVRGGGARTDLATFDTEAVARAIAASTVPVLTGIGHEVDRSVADEVAHVALKTPTACAAELVVRVGRYVTAAEQTWNEILTTSAGRLRAADAEVVAAAAAAMSSARRAVRHADRQTLDAARRVRRESEMQIERTQARLGALRGRLTRAAERPLIAARGRLDSRAELLASRADRGLATARRRLAAHPEALAARGRRAVAGAGRDLDATAERVRLLDPAHALARGWTITRTATDGRLVRAPDDAPTGTVIRTRTANGELQSRVEPDQS